jgi:hypothetical protein
LLFSKKFFPAAIIIALTLIVSCNEREKKIPQNKIDLTSSETVLKEAKRVLGNDTQMAIAGNFDEDTTKEFAAGTEINKPDKWGIQFHLLKPEGDSLADVFSTDLLEGSFTDALVRKEKMTTEPYDLIYYNSLDYYLGSGGGEVFAYLIDFSRKQTYFSHLFIEKGRRISLFLSENVTPEIKNFFLGVFKKDYPDLRIVDKDIDLDD